MRLRGLAQRARCRRFSATSASAQQEPTYDYVVAGGGVMGLSTAYHLASALGSDLTSRSVCVVEKDASYSRASAVLSAGGIRQQFSDAENIAMSLYGIDFIQNTDHLLVNDDDDKIDMQFCSGGYLFLGTERSIPIMEENNAVQREAGCEWIHLLKPEDVKKRFPWLQVDDIAMGSLGTANEGWFDPWSLISALRRKIVSMGVTVIDADVVALEADGRRITKAHLSPSSSACSSVPSEIGVRSHLVNTTGAWADSIVQMACSAAGVNGGDRCFPVRPRPRHVFYYHCPDPSVTNSPLVIDPSGVYFRREGEGGNFICGVSPPNEHQPAEADVDAQPDWRTDEIDYSLFERYIWPIIATRVPAFEEIKLQSAWTGLYEYNIFDQNAIIGPHHLVENMMLCNGFSGHGLQQSPAAGRAVAELLLEGRFTTIDCAPFAYERVLEDRPLLERQIV